MKTEFAPTSAPEQPVPLVLYAAQFEHWMRTSPRCGKGKAEDVCQEIRLALWELRDLPVTRDEARRVFMRLASRFESRAKRQVYQQGALIHDVDDFAEHVRCFNEQWERDTIRALALFNALEKLSNEERWLVKECKIEERSYAEVARQMGVTDNTVRNRLWRAMTKLMAFFREEKRREEQEKNQRENDEHSATIVAPLAFEFTDIERGMFSAIWRAEGRVPTFGGGPPDPPGPPVITAAPPIAVAPIVSAAVGSAVSAVTMAVVVVLLILFPTSIVAIYYFWDPPHSQTANKGLRAPPVSIVEDVVPMDYVPPQPPAPSRSVRAQASSSSAPFRSADASSSSPPIDSAEIERARRRPTPRFLPSP